MTKMKHFGYSLHADFYLVDSEILYSIGFFYNLLDELCTRLKMTKQAPPFIFSTPKEFPEKAGFTGFIPLVESGISVHTLTKKHFVSIDIYTCGELPIKDTLDWLSFRLGSEFYEHHSHTRGSCYYLECVNK